MSYAPNTQMVADMKRREGYSLKVYADSKGLPTIGYGRHHGVNFCDPDITAATADAWLDDDLQQAFQDARTLFPLLDTFDVVRRDALLDVLFNMGINTVEQFQPFITAVNNQDWSGAHLHLLTNTHLHLTPYVVQVGVRAVDNAGRIASGRIPKEFIV